MMMIQQVTYTCYTLPIHSRPSQLSKLVLSVQPFRFAQHPPSWSHALQLFRGSKRGNLPAISDSYIAINLFPVWFDNCDTRTLMVYCASCFFSREKIVLIDLLWVGTPTLSGSSVNYSICKKNDEFCPKIKHTGEEERPRSGTLCDSARCRN
jgi:hypothetical protein